MTSEFEHPYNASSQERTERIHASVLSKKNIEKQNDNYEGISRREFIKRGVLGAAWLLGLDALRQSHTLAANKRLLHKKERETTKEAKHIPKISLTIYFSPHATAESLRAMQEKFQRADVYLPEGIGHTEKIRAVYYELAAGTRDPESIVRASPLWTAIPHHEYQKKRLELIYQSHKPIFFIDLPEDHPLETEWYEARKKESEAEYNYDIHTLKEAFKTYADIQQKRETYICQRIEAIARSIQTNDFNTLPEITQEQKQQISVLKKKKVVQFLLEIGAAHTTLFHALKKTGANKPNETAIALANRAFNSLPYLYGYRSEIIRRYLFNKEVTDRLIAEMLLASLIQGPLEEMLASITHNEYKQNRFIRNVISGIHADKILPLCRELRRIPSSARLALLAQRGYLIPIPRNETELNIRVLNHK